MRRHALLLLAIGCGGKVDGDDPRADGSASTDGGGDGGGAGGGVGDAATTQDGPSAIDAGGLKCSKATVQLGLDGMGNCKVKISWNCGGPLGSYTVSGGCRVNAGFTATCSAEGVPSHMVTSPMCSCSDPDALAKLAAKLCGFPAPQ